MKKMALVFFNTLLISLVLPASADILELKSGEVFRGSYVGGSQNSIRFNVNNQIEIFEVNKIMTLTFTGPENNATGQAPVQLPASVPAPQAAVKQEKVEIPAGTPFMIRTHSVLDSGKMKKGHKFTAVLEANLVSNKVVVAKQGDTVYGQVVSVKKAGRLAGKADLSIELTGIRIKGEMVAIATNSINLTTSSSTRKTAGSTLGAAAIGGLIDGSSGARTGAKVGLGASILTPGSQVVVPSGTLLDFSFRAPLKL